MDKDRKNIQNEKLVLKISYDDVKSHRNTRLAFCIMRSEP